MKFSYDGVNAGSLDEYTWLTIIRKGKFKEIQHKLK